MRIIISRCPSGKNWQVTIEANEATLEVGLLDAEEMQQLAGELSEAKDLLLREIEI